MKDKIAGLLSLAFLSLTGVVLAAEQITLTTYYPAPFGAYDRVQLVPQDGSAISCDPGGANEGLMYYDSVDHALYVCGDDGSGTSTFDWVNSGAWTQAGDSLYPKDYNNPNLKVGIGTTTPAYTLDLSGDLRIDSPSIPGRDLVFRNWIRQEIYSNNDLVVYAAGNLEFRSGESGGPNRDIILTDGTGRKMFRVYPNEADNVGVLIGKGWTDSGSGYFPPYEGLGVKGSVGVGTNAPLNKVDVAGNMVVGSNFAAVETAPADGLLVEGPVGVNVSTAVSALQGQLDVRTDTSVVPNLPAIYAKGSDSAVAVEANAILGVHGYGLSGVWGESTGNGGYGVQGSSVDGNGVQGSSQSGTAGYFQSISGTGLKVISGSGTGITVNAPSYGLLVETGLTGLGTSTPSAKLDIQSPGNGWGLLRFTMDRSWVFEQIGTAAATRLRLRAIANDQPFDISASDGSLAARFRALNSNANEIYFVPSGGTVSVGTLAAPSGLSPMRIMGLPSDNTRPLLRVDTTTGDVYVDGPSSRRYKENIRPLDVDVMKLLTVETKRFNYINNKEGTIGLIAEDVDEAGLKELVRYTKEGLPDSIMYDKLPLYLLEIIKIQQKQIEELKAEVELLK